MYVSYQWDAPFSQVFDAVSSLPNKDALFFMIHIFCCPSEESLQQISPLTVRLEFLSRRLTKSPTVWLGVLRWSSDALNTEWLLSRRWILTEMLLCLRSKARAEFFCCLDGVYQPRTKQAAAGTSQQFPRVASLLQLLKHDCESVLKQLASIDYNASIVRDDNDLRPLMACLVRVYSASAMSDEEFCALLTQVQQALVTPPAAAPPLPPIPPLPLPPAAAAPALGLLLLAACVPPHTRHASCSASKNPSSIG